MAEVIKEIINTATPSGSVNTVVSAPAGTVVVKPVKFETSNYQTAEYLIYFFFGLLEVLLGFRLVLKVMGANVASAFVSIIYTLTGIVIFPFEGIFRRGFTQGLETTSVLEPSVIVALIVYAILAWGIVKLLRIFSRDKQQ